MVIRSILICRNTVLIVIASQIDNTYNKFLYYISLFNTCGIHVQLKAFSKALAMQIPDLIRYHNWLTFIQSRNGPFISTLKALGPLHTGRGSAAKYRFYLVPNVNQCRGSHQMRSAARQLFGFGVCSILLVSRKHFSSTVQEVGQRKMRKNF